MNKINVIIISIPLIEMTSYNKGMLSIHSGGDDHISLKELATTIR